METMFIILIPLVALALWAFKTQYPVSFELLFGYSMIAGLKWFDAFPTDYGLAFSLVLIVFSLCMAGAALYAMFAPRKENE